MTQKAEFCALLILFVPFACAGLTLVNTGLGRSRSAAHAALAALCAFGAAALAYCAVGYAWEGFPGSPAHVLAIGGKPWNWLAAEPLFLRGLALDGSLESLALLFQICAAGVAALVPLGTGGDRWRLSASSASAALLAGCTYPVFAHWVWGGGWLAQLGLNYGLGQGLLDAGGASSIHVVGGLTALSLAWILGPRRGKYEAKGLPAAIPGHNAVMVLFGCFLTLVGWMGLNGAGAILFAGATPARLVLIAVNTILSAGAAVLGSAAITGIRFGRPDASLCANGWVAGLVAGSAGSASLSPLGATITGLVAGALVTLTIAYLEWPLSVDDPTGAISVHAAAGIWGLLAAGVLSSVPGQFFAQVVGVATLLGFVLPVTYSLNWLLDRVHRQRVSPEGERQGMDLYELGAGAYPEFVTHNEEFTQQ